jgi:hypothetical protein
VQAPQQFLLGIDPDEIGLGGERLWEITRWHDIDAGSGRAPDPLYEDASWGIVKAIYRQRPGPASD